MIRFPIHLLLVFLYGVFNLSCNSQDLKNTAEKDRLTLSSKIIMPKVRGRIDHISYDSANHLAFIAALGNNTVEVVNINTKEVIHSIIGLDEPQGVIYLPSVKKLVVANGSNGDCIFFDAITYKEVGVVHLKMMQIIFVMIRHLILCMLDMVMEVLSLLI